MNDARRIMLARMRASRQRGLIRAVHAQDVVVCWRLRQAERIIDELTASALELAQHLIEAEQQNVELRGERSPWPSPWLHGPPQQH